MKKSSDPAKAEREFREIAEPVDGPSVMKARALARELGVDLVLGFLERDGEILYNSAAWIDNTGQVLHVHRKTHMLKYFEPDFFHPGFEVKAFDTRFGRAGMLICYERRIPEVARALALDGARILINPSYGSFGNWNTIMLRTRARENEAYYVFTHPKKTLVFSPEGDVMADVGGKKPLANSPEGEATADAGDEQGPGIVYAELSLAFEPLKHMARRRPEVFAEKIAQCSPGDGQRMSRPWHIKVAAVQMHSTHNLKENVDAICRHLAECAKQGVRAAVFPECATTGYFKNEIGNYSEADCLAAEKAIADACRANKIYAVVGSPYYEDGRRYNMALAIDAEGKTVYRQPKIHLIPGDTTWAQPGNRLGVFKIDGMLCSIVICHDSRYPELVRLPAIKGSRLVFYLSCEGNVTKEKKMEPYRAQVVARAVENSVYVVHANAPQKLDPLEGSHGQSRIVDPKGNLIRETPIFDETVLIEDLDLSKASGDLAKHSPEAEFMKNWWAKGLELVREAE